MTGTSSGWLHQAATLVGLLVLYFAVPDKLVWSDRSLAFSVLTMVAGTAILAWAITGQVRSHLLGDADNLKGLVTLLALVLVVFALGFYALEEASPGQVVGLRTRVDSLYFTLATMATVGYGDVHAAGQVARALVAIQMIFNIVFVGAIASVFTGRVRTRAQELDLARREAAKRGDEPSTPVQLAAPSDPGGLDARTSALVRIASLVASDAPATAYQVAVPSAVEAGVTDEDLVDVLRSVTPAVGDRKATVAASHVTSVLGRALPQLSIGTDTAETPRSASNARSPHDRVR